MVHFRFVRTNMDENNPIPVPANEDCIYPYGFYVFTAGGLHTFLDMMKAQAPADNHIYEVKTADGTLAYKKNDNGYKFLIQNKNFLIL